MSRENDAAGAHLAKRGRELVADAAEWLYQNRQAASSEWLKKTTPTNLLNTCTCAKKFDRVHAQPLTEQVEEALVRLVAIEQNAARSEKWEKLLQNVRGKK